MGSSSNVVISYNVQEYEMKTLSKVVTFQNLERFVEAYIT